MIPIQGLREYLEQLGWVHNEDSSDPMLHRKWHLICPIYGKVLAHEDGYLWNLCILKWALDKGFIPFDKIPNNKSLPF